MREKAFTVQIYRDFAFLNYMKFVYQDKTQINTFLIDLVKKADKLPEKHIILRDEVCMNFDKELLDKYMNWMKPENALIIFGS